MPVVHHILFAAATLALGASGLRVASLTGAVGLERVLAAATLAVAVAVVEVLALGLVDLGDSSFALAAAAGLTWVAARLAPAPGLPARDELVRWWRALPLGGRLAAGALAGAWLVWQVWLLRFPTLGFDTVLYHLSEATVWATNGNTGASDLVIRSIPVTNYPITDEVFLAWGLGLSRSLVPASVLVPPQVVLIGIAAWSGLRALAVPPTVRALGTAALCAGPPIIGWQSNGALPDPASLAWLLTFAALCLASRSRPLMLAPALVAAALAIGTKTTTAPLVLAGLAAVAWLHRAQLRAMWRPLAAATVLALGCGGVWYLRNLIDHGSPLWPFVEVPWGTPLPPAMEAANDSFASKPAETIEVVGDLYLDRFLGGIVLLAGAVLAPFLARGRRSVLIASAAAVLSFFIWTLAPFTGIGPPEVAIPTGVFSTTRYLIPAVAAAIVALALAGSGRDWRARLAQALLATGVGIELVQAFQIGHPAMPSPLTPLAGAVLGVATVAAVSAVSWRPRVPARLGTPALVAAALCIGALLAVPASGYLEHHAERDVFATGVTRWMAQQPDDERPVAGAPLVVGPLAGDRLRRRLVAIPRRTDCAALRARARQGYVVLYVGPATDRGTRVLSRCIRRRPDFRDEFFRAWAPAG